MNADVVRVLARIDLLSAEQGGRETVLTEEHPYRPNHNFGGADNRDTVFGQVDLPADAKLPPGGTVEAEIRFWIEGLPPLAPGLTWRIQEGGKLVGYGTVLRVLDA